MILKYMKYINVVIFMNLYRHFFNFYVFKYIYFQNLRFPRQKSPSVGEIRDGNHHPHHHLPCTPPLRPILLASLCSSSPQLGQLFRIKTFNRKQPRLADNII